MKRLAIVILNWNGQKLLEHYLPTVIATSEDNDTEIVVADNASTDGSIELLQRQFPTVRIVQLDRNYGFTGGYNRALSMIDNELVVLLNSDVATTPGWTKPLLSLIDSDPAIVACAPKLLDDKRRTHFEYAGAAGGYLDYLGYPFCRGRIMDNVEADNGQYDTNADALWASGAAMLIRRKEYLQCGGLDEDFFAHMEEIDMCWRLRNAGHRIVACPASVVYHLGGATLNSTNPFKTYLNFRNSLTMLVKNHNSRMWPLVVLARLLLDGVAGVKFLIGMQPSFCWAIIRAHWAFFGSMRHTYKKRKELASKRSREAVPEVRRLSIVFSHYILRKHTFASL